MEILEKVAYMKGLAEGLGMDGKSKEGKLLKVMMDIRDEQSDLEEGLDAVSDDLSDVETFIYELEGGEDGEEEDDEDGEVYQTTCPNCDEEIFFDETILADGSVLCPNCGEKLEFDLEDLSGCGGCCGACGEAPDEDEEDAEEGED